MNSIDNSDEATALFNQEGAHLLKNDFGCADDSNNSSEEAMIEEDAVEADYTKESVGAELQEEELLLKNAVIKLPTISFGYHIGPSLTTMHTSIMLMLSGCKGGNLVEFIADNMVERNIDMSESLLLDPIQYNNLLQRPEKAGFFEALQQAASNKASTWSEHQSYPSDTAFSCIEGEQGIGPIAVSTDLEICDGNDNNPTVFNHVELTSGAMRKTKISSVSSTIHQLVFDDSSDSMHTAVCDSTILNNLDGSDNDGFVDANMAMACDVGSIPTTIQITDNDNTNRPLFDDNQLEDYEIIFYDDIGDAQSLFQEAWNYIPPHIANIFD